MSAVQALLFDVDDTLYDHTRTARTTLCKLRDAFPVLQQRPFEALYREQARLLDAYHPQVLTGRLTPEEARAQRVSALFAWCGATLDPDDLPRIAALQRLTYQEHRHPVPGAPELLRALRRHVTIGLVTNNYAEEQRDKLRVCGLADLYDFMVTVDEGFPPKPDPAMFRAAVAKAGCGAERIRMVGDSWTGDIGGARAAGIAAVWFNRGGAPCPDPQAVAGILTDWRPTAAAVATLLGLERAGAGR